MNFADKSQNFGGERVDLFEKKKVKSFKKTFLMVFFCGLFYTKVPFSFFRKEEFWVRLPHEGSYS